MAAPVESERKSWSLTGIGGRSHLAPGFLELPTSAGFLVSTLIVGRAGGWKGWRSEEMYWNCWSRKGLALEAGFLRLARREKFMLWSRRATVLAETGISTCSSSSAIF